MKFKEVTIPAHTDYALVRIKGDQRDQFYGARVYKTRTEAQKEADRMNERYKNCRVEVEEHHYEESIGLEGTMRF